VNELDPHSQEHGRTSQRLDNLELNEISTEESIKKLRESMKKLHKFKDTAYGMYVIIGVVATVLFFIVKELWKQTLN